MKKFVITLSLVGMLVGPIAGLTAKDPKLSSEQRHKKLKNIETEDFRMAVKTYLVGALMWSALLGTVHFMQTALFTRANNIHEPSGVLSAKAFFIKAALCGLATIRLGTAWKNIVKNRMKRRGKKDFWKFLLKDFKPQETKSQ